MVDEDYLAMLARLESASELRNQYASARVDALAGVLAGFRWPGRKSFNNLTKRQRRAARNAARLALRELSKEV